MSPCRRPKSRRPCPIKKGDKTLKLSDLKGKKNVVLFFYPKAMTRGCTIESCGFRDVADKLAALDTVVIGISVDKLDDQQKFTDKEHLNFPLLADDTKAVTKAFGVSERTAWRRATRSLSTSRA